MPTSKACSAEIFPRSKMLLVRIDLWNSAGPACWFTIRVAGRIRNSMPFFGAIRRYPSASIVTGTPAGARCDGRPDARRSPPCGRVVQEGTRSDGCRSRRSGSRVRSRRSGHGRNRGQGCRSRGGGGIPARPTANAGERRAATALRRKPMNRNSANITTAIARAITNATPPQA